MKCLIIIAAKDEAASLTKVLPKLQEELVKAPRDTFSILVVDDGSTDDTSAVAKRHGCAVMRSEHNCGVGTSLRRGYVWAVRGEFDAVVTMDADGQHDPSFVHEMINSIHCGADAVVASRYHPRSQRHGVPLDRDLLNIAMTAQVRAMTGWDITDPLSGFWAMTHELVAFCLENDRQERYGIHLEHLIKFWWLKRPRPRLVEIPHPAIYGNGANLPLLTREYSQDNREQRIDRAGTHTLHVIQAMEDVEKALGQDSMARQLGILRYRHLGVGGPK